MGVQGDGESGVRASQDQERFRKTRHREQRRDSREHPERLRQIARTQLDDALLRRLQMRRLLHRDPQHGDRDERGDHSEPHHQAQVPDEQDREPDREQRTGECTHGVERLPQAVGSAPLLRRRVVGNQRIARRPANALADAVDEACSENGNGRSSEREQRLAEGGEAVSSNARRFPLAPCDPTRRRRRS